MSRLEEIRNEYAKGYGFENWDELNISCYGNERTEHSDKVSELYAKECSQASLEKASENGYCTYDAMIDKESITQESNIVIL